MAKRLSYEECLKKFEQASLQKQQYKAQIKKISSLMKKETSKAHSNLMRIHKYLLEAMADDIKEQFGWINLAYYYGDLHNVIIAYANDLVTKTLVRIAIKLDGCTFDDVMQHRVKYEYAKQFTNVADLYVKPLTVGERVLKDI